jgi:glucose dehydrogenase
MDFYWIWAIRSRVAVFVGILIALIPFWIDAIRSQPWSGLLSLVGMLLTVIGAIDGFGFIQRDKVRKAIADHDRKVRGLS